MGLSNNIASRIIEKLESGWTFDAAKWASRI